jgi:ceramide glucosyltransferase
LLALVACLRVDVAMMVGWLVLRDPRTLGLLPLLPLRDFVALWVWVVSLTGHKVVWRGDCFQLKEGKLMQIGSS